jgi:hypothetical protein
LIPKFSTLTSKGTISGSRDSNNLGRADPLLFLIYLTIISFCKIFELL